MHASLFKNLLNELSPYSTSHSTQVREEYEEQGFQDLATICVVLKILPVFSGQCSQSLSCLFDIQMFGIRVHVGLPG